MNKHDGVFILHFSAICLWFGFALPNLIDALRTWSGDWSNGGWFVIGLIFIIFWTAYFIFLIVLIAARPDVVWPGTKIRKFEWK